MGGGQIHLKDHGNLRNEIRKEQSDKELVKHWSIIWFQVIYTFKVYISYNGKLNIKLYIYIYIYTQNNF